MVEVRGLHTLALAIAHWKTQPKAFGSVVILCQDYYMYSHFIMISHHAYDMYQHDDVYFGGNRAWSQSEYECWQMRRGNQAIDTTRNNWPYCECTLIVRPLSISNLRLYLLVVFQSALSCCLGIQYTAKCCCIVGEYVFQEVQFNISHLFHGRRPSWYYLFYKCTHFHRLTHLGMQTKHRFF